MEKFSIDKIQISAFDLEDIDDILNIQEELNIHIFSKGNILNDIKSPSFKYFIAKYNNEIVGYISFSCVLEIEIEAIVVKKEFQRLGIGTSLLKFIFDFAKQNNVKNIFLEVRNSNTPAINLYNKLGFYKINIRKNYYTDTNEDALILRKIISP